MHAKAELKAAQAAARGKAVRGIPSPVHAGSAPSVATQCRPRRAPPGAARGTQLERLFATHDAVTARWLEYELDVAKIIAFPAMSDGRQPLTAAFLRAKRIADGLRPASAKARLSKEQLAEYRNAVADFEVAFDVAERDARRLRDSSFTEVERKRLDTAKKLLTVAIDEAATPAERQLAYRRVREELDGLISISDEAIEVLENKVMLELDAPTAMDEAARPRGRQERRPSRRHTASAAAPANLARVPSSRILARARAHGPPATGPRHPDPKTHP